MSTIRSPRSRASRARARVAIRCANRPLPKRWFKASRSGSRRRYADGFRPLIGSPPCKDKRMTRARAICSKTYATDRRCCTNNSDQAKDLWQLGPSICRDLGLTFSASSFLLRSSSCNKALQTTSQGPAGVGSRATSRWRGAPRPRAAATIRGGHLPPGRRRRGRGGTRSRCRC
jgi:hypothetical protein